MTDEEARNKLFALSAGVPDELISFGRALEEADHLTDGWGYFLERPEKWAPEYALWTSYGQPRDGDDTFDAWLEQLAVSS